MQLSLGTLTLQPYRQLLAGGEAIPLGKKALDILSVLAEANGGVVTKDELLEAVWPRVTVEENALQVHIVALRKALQDEADRLKTVRSVGYRLEMGDALAQKPASISNSADQSEIHRATPGITVLPFDNNSGDPDQDYFANGITEDIVTDLSKVSALGVMACRKAIVNAENGEIRSIARRFGATHVLEGSVRKAGNRVRITAQLVDGATGANIWAERYDREMTDIFDLQTSLSREIVGALKLQLLPSELATIEARGTRNADAYDCLLRARALRATMDIRFMPRSLEFYRRAIELDPAFARAWAGLATCLIQNLSHFRSSSSISLGDVRDAIERAAALEPNLVDVVASKAQFCVMTKDWNGVEDCIAKFRAMPANDWSIYSHLLLILGEAQAAVEQQRKVVKSDPHSPGASWVLQHHLACAGRIDEADAEFERSKAIPTQQAPFEWEYFKLLTATGRTDEARMVLCSYCKSFPAVLPFSARLLDAMEKDTAVGPLIKASIENESERDTILTLAIGHIAVHFGEMDLALAAVRKASDHAFGLVAAFDIWHPIFAELRRKPEFRTALEELGLLQHFRATGHWGEFLRPMGEDDYEVVR